MTVSRRHFLQGTAALSALSLLQNVPALHAAADPADVLGGYLEAMNTPFTAPLNLYFERVTAGEHVGMLLYDVRNGRLLTALDAEKPLPVASAFKGPLLLYFVDQVDRSVWADVPVAYWNAVSADAVPEATRAAWREHRYILRTLWQTLVLSDNPGTGATLSYVAEQQGRTDPIVAFNDWAQERVSISQLSGLSAWGDGLREGHLPIDERFRGRTTSISSQLTEFENMFTARDLGLFYAWMLSTFDDAQQAVCRDLLSTIHDNRGANLERLAQGNDGIPYSKNGSLGTAAGYVVADGGLIALPDEQLYLLVTLSLTPSDRQSAVPMLYEELDATLKGRYAEVLHNRHVAAISPAELLATYDAHLRAAYPQSADPAPGQFQYGFIRPAGVNIYRHADEASQLHNPIIKATRFGVHLLMQGALVRYAAVNDEWAELLPDDDRDNVRDRLGVQVFVKREDVWPISLAHAQPIDYLLEPTTSAEDKFVVILVEARELIAFEGPTPILHVPIVLNPDATPRGAQVITSKWFARSMQPWAPGVPFTCFFGAEGFALHGSPWQRWSTTVNQSTIYNRSSAGCVNVPDWMVTVGEHTRPADELLFRWVGGMENQHARVFDYPSEAYPALRIFNVDYAHNLRSYYRPATMNRHNFGWDDVIGVLDSIPLQAPPSFFV